MFSSWFFSHCTKQDQRTHGLVSHIIRFIWGATTKAPLHVNQFAGYTRNLMDVVRSSQVFSHSHTSCCWEKHTKTSFKVYDVRAFRLTIYRTCISRRLEANYTHRTIERLNLDPSAAAWSFRNAHILFIVTNNKHANFIILERSAMWSEKKLCKTPLSNGLWVDLASFIFT